MTLPGTVSRCVPSHSVFLGVFVERSLHRWLVLIAEFGRRNGWLDGAPKSCAHWLSWKCGLDLGAAREKVSVAPAIEDVRLKVALNGTTHHVETLVRQFRRVQEVEKLSREALQ